MCTTARDSPTAIRTRSIRETICRHTTFDISLGKSFGEKYRVSLTALNVANRRVLLDNSLTFGGFHFNDPRQLYVEVRWKFHY
jgi:outer membrane receptor protein involved in Fe transport